MMGGWLGEEVDLREEVGSVPVQLWRIALASEPGWAAVRLHVAAAVEEVGEQLQRRAALCRSLT